MVITALHKAVINPSFRVLIVAPYENQVRNIFNRLNELIDLSPILKQELISRTKTPFAISFKNKSSILGFTTGASSGNEGASIRGQRADYIIIDEADYMQNADFDAVLAIAAERRDIGVCISSTPTGARKRFWQCCTDRKLGYTEFHFPSTCSPEWCAEMEEEFRATLSPSGYVHEVLAEFGAEDAGVFNKDKIDAASCIQCYAYQPLTTTQKYKVEQQQMAVENYIPPDNFEGVYRPTVLRTMGVDWDKYQASSSILILDFDPMFNKFRVIRRIAVPKAEYSYDSAVNLIVDLNKLYMPSWIYVDRGYGEYQIERLHIHGEQHPESGLKHKVKGWQFSQTLPITDPITKMQVNEPVKQFMVNQLSIAFERDRIMLSPFDELLSKQLVNYSVERIGSNGKPIFTNKDEHFVDTLGLAYLAFVLEFPDIAKGIQTVDYTCKSTYSNVKLMQVASNSAKAKINDKIFGASHTNPWKNNLKNGSISYKDNLATDDNPADCPQWFQVSASVVKRHLMQQSIGTRTNGMIRRKMW